MVNPPLALVGRALDNSQPAAQPAVPNPWYQRVYREFSELSEF